ncbi:MAG: DNA polymerase IV [Desulfitobacteriaceae bacterium]|nr:DNA polymerase IV [Desulfitobacteriaceae bacterium]MDD4752589.1 DNA polymerase IV [Desulfitobacteriaceae bacterium]
MHRVILHADLNNFYASVECLHRPALRNLPVAVCGDPNLRHGIVLAKNYPAKKFGIKTGEVIWHARQRCPDLVVVPPDYSLYLRFSRLARKIYLDYTDQIEPFGIDEAWLDVTNSSSLYGNGEKIADEIRARIKYELGITASVGVSYNKIFAKLGSDMKKPDATTIISPNNFRDLVWPLPVSDLLYVGRATEQKFRRYGIKTIGDLAGASQYFLHFILGKWGDILWSFAHGQDTTPVAPFGEEGIIKSIGNSTTTPRDLENNNDVKLVIYLLSESVAARMREHGFKCRTVQIHVRNCDLAVFERQGKVATPTHISSEIALRAMELFHANYRWEKPVRSIGVRGTDFVTEGTPVQVSLFINEAERKQKEDLEHTVDGLRQRFGHFIIQRGIMLKDRKLTDLNPKEEHVIHPETRRC